MTPLNVAQKPKLRWLILFLAAVFVVWTASGWLLFDETNRGTFGDMFGAVNALFSGLAFATLIYTAWMQRDELALQREELAATRSELAGQRAQLAEQTTTFELQRFEDSFFSLLRTHGEIVSAMDLVDDQSRVIRSRDCFKVWYKRLRVIHEKLSTNPGQDGLAEVQASYGLFYMKHQAEIGHYFRHLYQVIKYVNGATIATKAKYTSLVRAQLSGYEHLLLFYNGLSGQGYEKFKPLIESYALLENMPRFLLISPENHLALYEPGAYGEDVKLL